MSPGCFYIVKMVTLGLLDSDFACLISECPACAPQHILLFVPELSFIYSLIL